MNDKNRNDMDHSASDASLSKGRMCDDAAAAASAAASAAFKNSMMKPHRHNHHP